MSKAYVNQIGPDYIIVKQNVLDTGGRTGLACCFTTAIVGFEGPVKGSP
jgi:hypothetical protein